MKQLSSLNLLVIVTFLIFSNFLFSQTSGGPDEYGYTWMSSDNSSGPAYSWTDISGTGINLNLTDDSASGAITIADGGFYFYGTNYDEIYVGDNGWVNFLESAYSPAHPFIPTNSSPNALISPFGEDLNPDFGNIYYQDNTDEFIIQYDDVSRFYNNGYHTFQIIMDKSDSTLVFNYNISDDWHYNGGTGTAITGIENEDGSSGLNIQNNILEDSFSIKFYQPAPYIHFDPENFQFTDIWVGNSDSTEVTLLNSGKSDLIITDIYLEDGTDISLTEMNSLPITIGQVNSGDFEKFFVKFTPLSEGIYNDNLVIISNSNDDNSTLLIPITANSLESDITMITPSIDFGNVQIEYAKDSKDMNIVIRNDGSAGLIINENTALTDGTIFEIVSMPSSLPFTILPNTQDTIAVRFTPVASVVYNDILEIYSNSPSENLVSVPITGTGVESEIIFNPTSLVFDATVQGQTETKSFRVTNDGDYKLTVSSMSLSTNESFAISGHNASFILQAGEFTDIDIDFTPIGVGAVIDSVVFITNLPDNYFVEVIGGGILPNLVTNPTNLNFGHLLLNETKLDSVILTNNGIGDLFIDNIYLTDAARYEITSPLNYPIILAPTEEYKVEIEFNPIYLGYVFDNLKIESNIGEKTVTIQGKGIFPDIEVSQSSYNFGGVQVGESKIDSLYITNNGDADLVLTEFNFETGINYEMYNIPALPMTIPPTSVEKVYIEFNPNSSQLLTDKITIVNNSLENEEIILSGNGTYPGISLDPVIVEFDSTLENTTSNKYFWIKNTGNETLNITEVSVSVPEFELFLASKMDSKDLSFNIDEGDSTRVRVQFTPSSNIFFTADITIIEETLGASTIPAEGQGTRATIALSSNIINFGNQNLYEATTSNVTISSTGNGILVLNSFNNNLNQFQLLNPPNLPYSIYPGSSIDIEVEFLPTDFISYSDSIVISNNSSLDEEKYLALNGNGVGGALQLANNEIDFENVNISESKLDSIYIRNIGNQDLSISGINLSINEDVFDIVSPISFPQSIGADDSILVKVNFTPNAVENYSSILSIESDDVLANNNEVELLGNGVSADIFLSPSHLDFGNVHINDTVLDSVNIINTGNADLILTGLTFNSGTYFSIVDSPSLPMTIPIASSYKIYLNYSANILGEVTDELNILNNSVSNVKVNLSGTGSQGDLVSTEMQLNFGSIDVGDNNRVDFYIKNTGDFEIEVENMFLTAGGGFVINDEFFDPTISAGDSTIIGVTFSPESHTSYFSFLVIESEVDDLNIELSGIGLRAYLEASINSYNFGDVNIFTGATSDLITLENSGNKELTISEIPFAVGSNFDYSNIILPINLLAGENTTFTVDFNPNLIIDYADSLQILNSSISDPVINLSGHGLGSNLNLSSSMINFSEVEIGETVLDTIIVTNTGNISLSVDSIYVTNESAFSIHSISGGGILPLNILAGEEEIVIIEFAPLNVTGYNSLVKFVSDSYDNSIDYCNLLGFGISANIALTPGFLDYSIVKVNEVFTKFFNISNTGNSVLIIDNLDFVIGSGYELYEIYSFPMNLAPSENISIGINFIPSEDIIYNDTLLVLNNANDGVFVALSGEGGQPDIEVNLNLIDFGDILIDENLIKQFVLRNNGNYLGHINDISNSDSHYQLSVSNDKVRNFKEDINKKSFKKDNKFSLNIPANDSVIVDVTFSPTSMIDYDDVIEIDGEDNNYTIDLSGRGIKAISLLSNTVMDYGSIQIATNALDTLSIENTGNTNLEIDSFFVVNNNAFEIIDFENYIFPIILQPETEFDIVVNFSPSYITSYSNRIKILSNNYSSSSQYVYLLGSGEAIDMVITPTLLDYGMVSLGAAATNNFRITNNGSENIIINDLQNELPVFTILNAPSLPYNLAPSNELFISVRFFPNNNITYNDTLEIITNSLNGNVVLEGTGAMASFELSEEEIDFDSVFVNNLKIESFFIVNDGTSSLDINSISLNISQFKIYTQQKENKFLKKNTLSNSDNKTLYVVEPNDSLEIFVSFLPTESILYTDIVTIESDIGTKTIDLFGKGAVPLLNTNTYSLDFFETEVFTEKLDSIIIRNETELAVNISSLVFTNSEMFSSDDFSLPAQIPINDSITVKIKFVPTQISHFDSELFIVNNSGITPVIDLTGSGFSNELVLSKLHNNFGSVSVNDEILDTLNISNNSGDLIVFNNLELVTGLHFDLISSLTIPFNLEAGENVDIVYSMSPQFYSSNEMFDSILVKTSLIDAKVVLTGMSENINLALSSETLDFDSVEINTEVIETVTLTNNGLGRVVIDDISMINNDPFTVDFPTLDYLQPEESVEISISFLPTIVGDYTDSVKINTNGPTKYVSLFGIGKEGIGIENYELQIINYELGQNYPNPFNNRTIINFAIPNENSIVMLKLFNSKGELVENIINNKNYQIGHHSISFDMSKYSTGIYYYGMEVKGNKFNSVKKMMLIK